MSGWENLGNAIGGGNKLPAAVAYQQGMQLGASTQDALAQARSRIDENNAKENLDKNLADAIPDPQTRAIVVNGIRSGVDPRNITGANSDAFKLATQKSVQDPNTSPGQTARDLLSIGQNANLTHNVGEAGSFTNELDPGKVTVSPLGEKIAQAGLAKTQAETQNEIAGVPLKGAQTRQANVEADNGGGKLPTGYTPLIGSDGQPVIDASTMRPKLTRIAGGPADIDAPKPMGAVALRSVNRMLDSGSQAVADVGNLAALPAGNVPGGAMGSTLGMLGYGSGPQKTLMESLKGDLTNRAAPDTVKMYTTLASGLSRGMASMEAAGMIPNGQFTDSFNKLQNVDGDTNYDALMKMAQIKQITHNALESMILGNVSVPADRQAVAQKLLDKIDSAIPYDVQDVIKLHNSDGSKTLSQIAGLSIPSKVTAPAAPAGATPSAAPAPSNTMELMNPKTGQHIRVPAAMVAQAKGDGFQELP